MSVVNTQLNLKIKRVMATIFSIDSISRDSMKLTPCTNLDGSQKEGGKFLNLLQKEGGTQKGGGGSLRKGVRGGGFQPWRKLWPLDLLFLVFIREWAYCFSAMVFLISEILYFLGKSLSIYCHFLTTLPFIGQPKIFVMN